MHTKTKSGKMLAKMGKIGSGVKKWSGELANV